MPVAPLRAAVFAVAVSAAAAVAQTAEPPLIVYHYVLRHQPAAEALHLVRPLLSPRGTVELQPRANKLVIRDSLAATGRIVPMLKAFDHPAVPLRLEVLLVEAGPAASDVLATPEALPAGLMRGLRALFKYEDYRLLARASLEASEGEQVVSELADGYQVGFRFGTVLADRRLRLHDFRVSREAGGSPGPPPSEIIHTNLNLWLAQPFTLVLARDEASRRALMVVLEPALDAALVEGPR
jgi:hypothetical protein